MRPSPLVLLALVAACGRPAEPAAPPAPSAPAASPAGPTATETPPASAATPTETDAPPPPAPPRPPPRSALAIARSLVAIEPAGEQPLSPEAETVVDPAATFRVVLAERFADARLLLLDGADAALPAKGTREVGQTTVLTLAPTNPLVPGSRYHLRVDGDRTRDLHDASGGVHAPFTVALLAAGTPPPPEPAPKKRRRR